ncbi:hypothetical protein EGW08_015968 [Elysia chlorotica]|uniref:Uncharacterized protein n=1 Tax=Elysia chlorotica TaxID=188477 RepID=A0A433T3Z2_ELYCH|nr:hypothetical protein EGW08_015968 [Elysia chlorotica]
MVLQTNYAPRHSRVFCDQSGSEVDRGKPEYGQPEVGEELGFDFWTEAAVLNVLVKKKDGSPSLCVDFHKLNAITILDVPSWIRSPFSSFHSGHSFESAAREPWQFRQLGLALVFLSVPSLTTAATHYWAPTSRSAKAKTMAFKQRIGLEHSTNGFTRTELRDALGFYNSFQCFAHSKDTDLGHLFVIVADHLKRRPAFFGSGAQMGWDIRLLFA